MQGFIDYYDLLQVQYYADESIIKAAYRRLCHKHHPDNDGDNEPITSLNMAYDILLDQRKRDAYNLEWLGYYKEGLEWSFGSIEARAYDHAMLPLFSRLTAYMNAIQAGSYDVAYGLLSKYNRKRIFKKDFIKWQKLVSRIHQVLDYNLFPIASKDQNLDEIDYLESHKYMIFRVQVREMSRLLNKEEDDTFNRILVNEDGQWFIFLMNDNVKKIIKKYDRIVALWDQKTEMTLKAKFKNSITYSTGWVSKQLFLFNLEHEQLRYLRYQSTFSIVAFFIDNEKKKDVKMWQNLTEILERHTRILDSICRLRSNLILVLLPETNLESAYKTQNKLLQTLSQNLKEPLIEKVVVKAQVYDTVKELLSEVVKA